MPSPFEWSAEMDGLYWNSVVRDVLDDPRTIDSENLKLGYPFEKIREEVLAKGLTDFSQGHDDSKYGHLTAHDKVLLYCFVNLRMHFFAALATFEAHRALLEDLFASEGRLLVLDIGCGPGTAGLALADLLPGRSFDYLGIDLAPPMHAKALALWEAARARGLIGKDSTATFRTSWTDVAVDQVAPASSLLVVLSYCCASHTLTWKSLQSLAHTVRGLQESRTGKPLVLAYMNSTNALANRNYEVFKQALGLDPGANSPTRLTIEYRNRRGKPVTVPQEFVHEVLRLKRS
jgi:SAM-dependent methyltransferase